MTKSPKILVVDDQPVNLLLMCKTLEREGMEVTTAQSGQECLQLVSKSTPDLILLDVMMPGMDGLEVCRILKLRPNTASVPIIFLTARSSKAGKIEGLTVGAVDYITKPIDLEETVARVRTQLRYHALFRENLDLTQRLGDARRAAAMGALSQGISHNLNNLLGVVYGYLELAKLSAHAPDTLLKHLNKIDESVVRMTKIVRQVTAVSTRCELVKSRVPAGRLIDGAVLRFRHELGTQTQIQVENRADASVVEANIEAFEDAITKLLTNAWESYGDNPPADTSILIEISCRNKEGHATVEFAIHDRGIGLDPALRDNVFEPFVSTKSTVGVGMGLTIARNGIRNLGGDIVLLDRAGGGTTAVVSLPQAETATASAA